MQEETKGVNVQDRQVEILKSIKSTQLDMRVVLMSKDFSIGKLISLSTGAVLMFDTSVEEKAQLFVNERLMARGDVVQANERYALKLTDFAN